MNSLTSYPVQFSVDYPDRPLNRLTTAFRIFVAIPILIVLGRLRRASGTSHGRQDRRYGAGAAAVLRARC